MPDDSDLLARREELVVQLHGLGGSGLVTEIPAMDALRWAAISASSSQQVSPQAFSKWATTASFLLLADDIWHAPAESELENLERFSLVQDFVALHAPWNETALVATWDEARTTLVDIVVRDAVAAAQSRVSTLQAINILRGAQQVALQGSPEAMLLGIEDLHQALNETRNADVHRAEALLNSGAQTFQLPGPLASTSELAWTLGQMRKTSMAIDILDSHGESNRLVAAEAQLEGLTSVRDSQETQAGWSSTLLVVAATGAWFILLRRALAWYRGIEYVARANFLMGTHL